MSGSSRDDKKAAQLERQLKYAHRMKEVGLAINKTRENSAKEKNTENTETKIKEPSAKIETVIEKPIEIKPIQQDVKIANDNEEHLKKIENESFVSEKSFRNSIQTLCNFASHLNTMASEKEGSFAAADKEKLNSFIKEFNEYIKPYDGINRSNTMNSSASEDIISAFSDEKKWRYIQQASVNFDNFSTFLITNQDFLKKNNIFPDHLLIQPNGSMKQLADLIVEPVQRGPRYVMLAKELEKNSTQGLYNDLVNFTQNKAIQTNEMIRAYEKQKPFETLKKQILDEIEKAKNQSTDTSKMEAVMQTIKAIKYNDNNKEAYLSLQIELNNLRVNTRNRKWSVISHSANPIERALNQIDKLLENNTLCASINKNEMREVKEEIRQNLKETKQKEIFNSIWKYNVTEPQKVYPQDNKNKPPSPTRHS